MTKRGYVLIFGPGEKILIARATSSLEKAPRFSSNPVDWTIATLADGRQVVSPGFYTVRGYAHAARGWLKRREKDESQN